MILALQVVLPNAPLSAPLETPLETRPTNLGFLGFSFCDASGINPIETRNVGHRWYESVLTQQQVIADQIDNLRSEFDHNLLDTADFLDRLSFLFDRADRLYIEWKKLGWPVDESALYRPFTETVLLGRKDLAVGRSINYLRLSLINLFLGYADSNSALIETAEGQAILSKVWRTRSLLFLRNLDS